MCERLPSGTDVLVPVPLHPRRERERGYNQAALLADVIGRSSGLDVARGLERTRPTLPQARLSGSERRSNILGAFSLGRDDVAGERVVLVDDVCTTAATLEECAGILRQAGAVRVSALVFARA